MQQRQSADEGDGHDEHPAREAREVRAFALLVLLLRFPFTWSRRRLARGMYDGGFTLHHYQRAAADAAENENLLIVLPTNSGKTIIAAQKAFVTLKAEATKKVVFITPKRTLAMQQAKVLLRHIGPLHMRSDETSTQRRNEPRWRLARPRAVDVNVAHRMYATTRGQWPWS